MNNIKSQFSRPVEDIVSADFSSNSNNYTNVTATIEGIVNNNKIGIKIDTKIFIIQYKYIIFASNKDTIVLLIIKNLMLWES